MDVFRRMDMKMKKRWIAIIIAATMAFASAMPMTAMAEGMDRSVTMSQDDTNQDVSTPQDDTNQDADMPQDDTNQGTGMSQDNNTAQSGNMSQNDIDKTSQEPENSGTDIYANNEATGTPTETPLEGAADKNLMDAQINVASMEDDATTKPVKEEKRLEALLSDDQKIISASVYGADEAATALQFGVWSEKNGQDDLTWVSAVKSEDGSWKADIGVKGHKSVGNYFIHAYQTVNGNMQFAAADTITISAPKATVSVDEESKDNETGTFKVLISNLNVPAGIKNIRVAIWGEKDGQNDIVWYTPKQDGDSYVINVDAGEHRYETGQYNIHCYITDENDIESYAGGASTNVEYKKSLTAEVSENEKTISATAIGASGATAVSFAVWSEKNGQDDLTWISGVKQANGRWTANISVKGHKHAGKYLIHCYATLNNKMVYFAGTSVNTTVPKASVTVDGDSIDDNSGRFKVLLSDLNVPSGIKNIRVAVWGEKNGQNDIVWYTPAKDGDDYFVDVAASRHKYETGKYFVHCYITDENDIQSYAGGTEQNVKVEGAGSLTITKDAEEKNVAIRYIGANGAKLRAAVWSEKNGQDDLKWYSFADDDTSNVPIKNHATSGKYYVHVYDGNKFVKGGTFSIDSVSASEVKASNIDGNRGTFKLTISGVDSISGVQKVSVPVWVGSDQSKIYWYEAKKASDGTYYVNVNVANHKYAFGKYTTHIYVYGNNGVSNFCCGTQVNIEADRYVYGESTGTYSERVWVVNPGNVLSVSFPTWSETNGQDDVKWYSGIKSGNAWYADVKSENHLHSGSYITHCYADYGNGNKFVGATFYRLNYDTHAKDKARDRAYIKSLLTYDSRPDVADFNIDYLRAAKNLVTNESIGYGHTWPKTISCAGLVGLTLTHLGYGDFIKNDPFGWGYIDLDTEYENTLINEVGATWNPVTITGANYMNYLQPGDILYTYTNQAENHIAFYAGNGKTIEARGPSGPTDADDTGYETGIYDLSAGGSYQGYFRIPADRIQHI